MPTNNDIIALENEMLNFSSVPGIPAIDDTVLDSTRSSKIGPYEVFEELELGSGEFATVFVCCKHESPRRAVKQIDKSNLILKRDIRRTIRRIRRVGMEIEAMRRLNHPNVIQIFEVYHTPLFVHLILETGGGDLYTLHESHPEGLSEAATRFIALALVQGVKHFHERGVMHRDLKPENVLVRSSDISCCGLYPQLRICQVQICDFGLCALVAPPVSASPGPDLPALVAPSATPHGAAAGSSAGTEREAARWRLSDFAGSPGFFAPEMILASEYDGRLADMWSLGCVLLESCLGPTAFNDGWMTAYTARTMTLAALRDALLEALRGLLQAEWPHEGGRNFCFSLLVISPQSRPDAATTELLPWLNERIDENPIREEHILGRGDELLTLDTEGKCQMSPVCTEPGEPTGPSPATTTSSLPKISFASDGGEGPPMPEGELGGEPNDSDATDISRVTSGASLNDYDYDEIETRDRGCGSEVSATSAVSAASVLVASRRDDDGGGSGDDENSAVRKKAASNIDTPASKRKEHFNAIAPNEINEWYES